MQDKNSRVRTCAAEALGRIGDARAVEPLIEVLKDEKDQVRTQAVEALETINTPKARSALKKVKYHR